MRDKIGLGLMILTIGLMTASVAQEFVRQQPLSVLSFVFVLSLVLSAVILAATEFAGGDSVWSRLWHSRAFGIASFVITFVVILAIGLFW